MVQASALSICTDDLHHSLLLFDIRQMFNNIVCFLSSLQERKADLDKRGFSGHKKSVFP